MHTAFKNSEEATVKVDFAFGGILECWALNYASCRRHWVCSALYKEPPFYGCGSRKTNLQHLASLRAPFSCLLFNGKKKGYEKLLILACSLSIFIFKQTMTETMCLFLWLTIRERKGLKRPFEYTLSKAGYNSTVGYPMGTKYPRISKSIASAQHHPQASEAVSLLPVIISSVATSSADWGCLFLFLSLILGSHPNRSLSCISSR